MLVVKIQGSEFKSPRPAKQNENPTFFCNPSTLVDDDRQRQENPWKLMGQLA